ncbi:hypothetical protein MCAMS1_02304 [biofilm metagenome]
MALMENTVQYFDGEVTLEAFYAFDDSMSGQRPAVLISHTWAGRNDFIMEKARKIAGLGYVGFALDMYGNAKVGSDNEENMNLMRPFMTDRIMLQQRITAAIHAVKQLPWVDENKIAAMGFCFGGLCVLDLARTGVDIKGVVSFHGLLGAPGNTQGNKIKAKVLVLHGYDDPMATPQQTVAFQDEMTAARADWQFVSYGNTMHAFTNPIANDPGFGTVYQPDADRRSWQTMQSFFTEIFA